MTTEEAPDAPRPWRKIALRIEHLSKTFPGTRALNDVSLEVEAGTIHCLLGGNGSGKSSLIKILAGVYQGDPGGTISVDDESERADRTTPDWARVQRLVRGRESRHRPGVPRS
jgi:ribose transport system ATP-binding protein